jgi:hypothetical protein
MNEYQKWPSNTIALLAMKVNSFARGQHYVDWAVQALTEGFDSRSLAILASLDLGKDFPRWEAEAFFMKAVSELDLIIPDDETILREHFINLVAQIQKRIIDPIIGIECIHREVVSPLGHPSDLLPWCLLWEGNDPGKNDTIPDEKYSSRILEFAQEWLTKKEEDR